MPVAPDQMLSNPWARGGFHSLKPSTRKRRQLDARLNARQPMAELPISTALGFTLIAIVLAYGAARLAQLVASIL